MTNTLQHTTFTAKKLNGHRQRKMMHREINEDMAKFNKTMEELRLLKCVAQDLKNYRKMIRVKRYD